MYRFAHLELFKFTSMYVYVHIYVFVHLFITAMVGLCRGWERAEAGQSSTALEDAVTTVNGTHLMRMLKRARWL